MLVTISNHSLGITQSIHMGDLDTDYLVIGAGATSMTFIDEVISSTENIKIIGTNINLFCLRSFGQLIFCMKSKYFEFNMF